MVRVNFNIQEIVRLIQGELQIGQKEARNKIKDNRQEKRKKGLSKSLLDQITGIGKQRKRSLLNHFGSARSVESASFEELKSVEGIEDNIAKKIYNYFHE